jgi:hypothetical protein
MIILRCFNAKVLIVKLSVRLFSTCINGLVD